MNANERKDVFHKSHTLYGNFFHFSLTELKYERRLEMTQKIAISAAYIEQKLFHFRIIMVFVSQRISSAYRSIAFVWVIEMCVIISVEIF